MEEKEQNKTKQQRGKNRPKKIKQVTRAIAMGAQKNKNKE